MNLFKLCFSNYQKNKLYCVIEKKTYHDLYLDINKYTQGLKENNIKSGDNVAVRISSGYFYTVLLFSCLNIGATFIPLNPNSSKSTLNKTIKKTNPKLIISENVFNEYRNCVLLNNLSNSNQFIEKEFGKSITGSILIFTSGSSGEPKGVKLSEKNLITNISQISAVKPNIPMDTLGIIRPLEYASTITGEILYSIYKKYSIVFCHDITNINSIISSINKHKINMLSGTISLLKLVAKSINNIDSVASVKVINLNGEQINYNSCLEVEKKFPNAEILLGYGLTEASPRVTQARFSKVKCDNDNKINLTVGKILSSIEFKIVNENYKEVKLKEKGELLIKGDNIINQYYKNSFNFSFKDGFLCTGDIFSINDLGYFYYHGRKDERINISGQKFYPKEVEEIIKNFNFVEDVIVSNQTNDHILTTLIKFNEEINKINETKKLDLLKIYLANNLEGYKIPKRWIVVEELPMSDNFKKIRNGKRFIDYIERVVN
ncbi:class I adenylate-forming enzyme family protein [Bacillus velezensis]|uniref:class I adenylate-forming enzyme family protein n=1 Tax=Bacillus velezensis TaxID=492670 RepID=UPI0039B118AE